MTAHQRFLFLAVLITGGTAIVLFLTFSVLTTPHSTLSSRGSRAQNTKESTTAINTPTSSTITPTVHNADTTFETTLDVDGVGTILVEVSLPTSARYSDGAPVVVNVPTFYTPGKTGFEDLGGTDDAGAISLNLMFPGRNDGNGNSSGGTDDYGGANSAKALRDVALFGMGQKTNSDGFTLAQLSTVQPLSTDVGFYAFSHPGMVATEAMGMYANDLKTLAFYVGRENPTLDSLASLELGYRDSVSGNPSDKNGTPVYNPEYSYLSDYSAIGLTPDYNDARYDASSGAPYLDVNRNNTYDSGDFLFRADAPNMFGKIYFSSALLRALKNNGALTSATWPKTLATPEEADALWPSREPVTYYSKLSVLTSLHTMLVFAKDDHVQVVADKPHIHQAFNGFRSASLWTRLNPDASYVSALNAAAAKTYTEHDANTEPSSWANPSAWAYSGTAIANSIVPLAAVLEMMDRTHENNWETNLTSILQP